jgi:hypothetical protein
MTEWAGAEQKTGRLVDLCEQVAGWESHIRKESWVKPGRKGSCLKRVVRRSQLEYLMTSL